MGVLAYAGMTVEFDDEVLTHLQVIVVQRFRRSKSFLMSWLDAIAIAIGDGRSAMWLTPAVPIRFSFEHARAAAIDRTG